MGLFKKVTQFAVPAAAGTAVGLATGNPLAGVMTGASLYGAQENKKAQDSANATNLQSAREQMKFQQEMSDTSYQRGMKDMYAAGLNPMLAFSQGGASAPSGAMASVSPSTTGRGQALQKGVAESIASATQMQAAKNQTVQTASNIGLQTAQAQSAQSAAKLAEMNSIKAEAETKKTLQDLDQSANTFKARKDIIETQSKMQKVDQEWQEKEKWMQNIQRGTDSLGNLIMPFKGMLNKALQGNSAKQPPSTTKHYYGPDGEHQYSVETKHK